MNAVKTFNGLNGATVSRKQIESLIEKANSEGQFHLVKRLEAVLSVMGKKASSKLELEISDPAFEIPTEAVTYGLEYYAETGKFTGLGKGFSQNDVYQKIADKMISMIKEASGKNYVKKWNNKQYSTGYLIPFNYDTKKRYRGVNVFLLTEFDVLANPFFLSKKQIEKHKGFLNPKAKKYGVVYYTKLFKIENRQRKIDFSSYKLQEAIDFALANGMKEGDVFYLPILKWHEVYNGADIKGIDFDLDNFKVGYINNEMPTVETLPIAEAILKNYPQPQPRFSHGGNRAFYSPGNDSIKMPFPANFETIQDYYRTAFHEYAHSTGHSKRMARDFTGRFGSKKYAFEELIAEWGATFLSAEAGIPWHTNKNHAEYIKNWNAALTHIKDNNRFVMQACTAAQKLADYVLQFDDHGNPKYFADLKKQTKKVKAKVVKKMNSNVPKKLDAKKKEVFKAQFEEFAKARVEKRKPNLIVQPRKRKKTTENKSQQKLRGPAVEKTDIVQTESTVTDPQTLPAVKTKMTVPDQQSKYRTITDHQRELTAPKERFDLKGDLQKFLGKIEKKPVQSLAITLDTEEGGGKTHTFYQWANEFCEAGYSTILWSLEEHASSELAQDKAKKYFGKNISCIPVESERADESKMETFDRIIESIADFDAIFIDSWQKLVELNAKINFDLDMRKKFHGKVIFVIVQRTADGKMRGGSKVGFDGDVIIKGVVDRDDFRNNYLYNHKNRYNDFMPISDLKYSPFLKGLIKPEIKEEIAQEAPKSSTPLKFTAVEIN